MQPFSNASPSEAWTARSRPARERMRGRTLVPAAADAGRRTRWRRGRRAVRVRRRVVLRRRPRKLPRRPRRAPSIAWQLPSRSFRGAAPAPHDRTDLSRSDLRSAAEPLGRAGRRFSASASRSRGGAVVTSSSSRRAVVAAMSSTARSNASVFARDGFCIPLTLRTYWSAASRISASVVDGSKLWSVLMFRHMAGA